MRRCSEELERQVYEARYVDEETVAVVAERFGISTRTVTNLVQRYARRVLKREPEPLVAGAALEAQMRGARTHRLRAQGFSYKVVSERTGRDAAGINNDLQAHRRRTGSKPPIIYRPNAVISRGHGDDPVLTIGSMAVRLARWEIGQAICWEVRNGGIELYPAARPYIDLQMPETMPAEPGYGGNPITDQAACYLYLVAKLPLADIAKKLGCSQPSVLRYARRHAQRNGIDMPGRHPEGGRKGTIMVRRQRKRRCVVLEQAVRQLGWQIGQKVRWWRVHPGRIRIVPHHETIHVTDS